MIIDAHAHISCWEELGIAGDIDYVIELMGLYGIDKACVSNSRSLRYDFVQGNDEILKAMRKYPDRILGYATVNPWCGEMAVQEFRRRILEQGMIGLKLHVGPTRVDYHSPLCEPLFREAMALDVPVLTHCYDGGSSADKVASTHPDVKIILGHMGGADWFDAILVAKRHSNLFLEICSSNMERGIIEEAVKHVGAERVLFGTDLPPLDPVAALYRVKEANITEREKRLILGENMARILKLEV